MYFGCDMTAIKPIKNNPFITVMDKVCKNRKAFYMEKLTDSFYRGSEPDVKKIKELGNMGIKTILNLKSLGKKQLDSFSKIAEENGMKYINIPLNPFHIKKSFPHIVDVIKSGSKDNPIFIHCTYGKDRTGFVSALINFLKNGFTMKEAISDMTEHGCKNPMFSHLKSYLKNLEKQMKK